MKMKPRRAMETDRESMTWAEREDKTNRCDGKRRRIHVLGIEYDDETKESDWKETVNPCYGQSLTMKPRGAMETDGESIA